MNETSRNATPRILADIVGVGVHRRKSDMLKVY